MTLPRKQVEALQFWWNGASTADVSAFLSHAVAVSLRDVEAMEAYAFTGAHRNRRSADGSQACIGAHDPKIETPCEKEQDPVSGITLNAGVLIALGCDDRRIPE